MTDRLPTTLPTRQATAIEGRSRRGAVTGKLMTALDLMVWSGERRADAAERPALPIPRSGQRCAGRTS